MNIEEIVEYINRLTTPRLLRFVSEKGENSCRECLKYHDQIFEENDKNMPHIPLHPNCRCKYEYLTNSEVTELQNELRKAHAALIEYSNQITAKTNQLLAEYAKEIKKHTQLYTTQAVISAFSAVWQLAQLIEKGKTVKEALENQADNAKLTGIVKALLISYWVMKSMEQINKSLQEKMKQTGIDTALPEIISWLSPMQKIENLLKEWHYNRLNHPMQQSWALPQTPEEAIKRGFVRAPDSQILYHRNKGQKDNVKFHSQATGQEVIFNSQGKIITDIENIGTYNYFPPSPNISSTLDFMNTIVFHLIVDVLPYYKWGNGEQDTTSLKNRLFGSEKAFIFDFYLTVFEIIRNFDKNIFGLEK